MAEYGLNLWDYWRIIHKRKWIIISIFLVSVISAHFFGRRAEPVYQSSVTLNVDVQQPIAEITGTGVTFWGTGGRTDFSTQLELIKGYSILKDTALKLGYITSATGEEEVLSVVNALRGRISVEQQKGTSLVELRVADTDPKKAKDIVETVASVFIEKNWERKVAEARRTKVFVEKQLQKIDGVITNIKKKLMVLGIEPVAGVTPVTTEDLSSRLVSLKFELSNLRERYTDNHPRITNIRREIDIISKQVGEPPEEVEVQGEAEIIDADRLKNELAINEKLYALLKERYEKALILEASKAKDIEIVNPAVLPKTPISPGATVNVFFGGALGLVLGLVAALVVESMDTSIGTIEDVEEYLQVPVLGVIPHIEVRKKEEVDFWKEAPPPEEKKKYTEIMARLVTQYRPKSVVAEAYRNLQTYIKFSAIEKVGNCIMFTSAGVREGKTITTVNSALSMAQMGYKTVLIDADLRRPAVHKLFGIERGTGLTEVLLGTYMVEDSVKTMDDIMLGNIKASAVLKTYGMENLHIVTAGRLPTNPAELLSSQNMVNLIRELKEKYQVIFIDSAPILPVTDSCVLSSRVDGVIMVYEVGRVARGALRRSKIQIENAKGKPIGIVLNNMRVSDMRFGSPYYYYRQKYYGEEEHKE
jgi:tyrosine-protein kinase Etk/Wzc